MWYRAESEGRLKEIVKVILERSNRKFDENLIPNNDKRICNDTIQVGTWTCVCVDLCGIVECGAYVWIEVGF